MFSAVLDTCVLVPPTLADLSLRIAEEGAFAVRWSQGVLEELRRVMLRKGVAVEAVDHRIASMARAFPYAEVEGYESLVGGLTCDSKDRHVLAATICSDANTLVTFNLRDFPADALKPWDIVAVHPDEFLLDQLDLHSGKVVAAIRSQAADYRRPSMTVDQILGRLARTGVPLFADEIRRHL